MALNRTDLDLFAARGCQAPGCDHSGHDRTACLHSKCHPKAGLWASYVAGEGVLTIICRECRATVARVAVADA